MSWSPLLDHTIPMGAGVDVIETVIVPRARDLGGFEVHRALPSARRQMVGPFIFTKFNPIVLAKYSIRVVLPYPGGETSNNIPIREVRLFSPATPSCLARLEPIKGRYTSLINLFLTKEVKTLGFSSCTFNVFL